MARRHSTPTPDNPPGSVTRYRDRIFDSLWHDPYHAEGKYREPIVCPGCARTHDQRPAVFVTLSGDLFNAHRAELLQLARNSVENERSEHPLHRIMNVVETLADAVITTCDMHSARRIGEALERAYDGDLDISFGEDEYSVRVNWSR